MAIFYFLCLQGNGGQKSTALQLAGYGVRRVRAITPLQPCSLMLGPIQRKNTSQEFYIIRKADYYLMMARKATAGRQDGLFSAITSTVQRDQGAQATGPSTQLLSQTPFSTLLLLTSLIAAKTIGYTKMALTLNFLSKSGLQCKVYPSCKQQGAASSSPCHPAHAETPPEELSSQEWQSVQSLWYIKGKSASC